MKLQVTIICIICSTFLTLASQNSKFFADNEPSNTLIEVLIPDEDSDGMFYENVCVLGAFFNVNKSYDFSNYNFLTPLLSFNST